MVKKIIEAENYIIDEQTETVLKMDSSQVLRKPKKLYKPNRIILIKRKAIPKWIAMKYPKLKEKNKVPVIRTVDNWLKAEGKLRLKSILSGGLIYVEEKELKNYIEKRWPEETRQ